MWFRFLARANRQKGGRTDEGARRPEKEKICFPLLPKLNKIVKQILSIALSGVFIYIFYLQWTCKAVNSVLECLIYIQTNQTNQQQQQQQLQLQQRQQQQQQQQQQQTNKHLLLASLW